VFKFQTANVSYLTILCLYHLKIEFYFTDTEYSITQTMHYFFDQEHLFINIIVECCKLLSAEFVFVKCPLLSANLTDARH